MESYMEKARTLSERFGITPAAAMKALEESDGDILDAVIRLENEGVINRTSANYSTAYNEKAPRKTSSSLGIEEEKHRSGLGEKLRGLFRKSIQYSICVSMDKKPLGSMPVLIFILLFAAGFRVAAAAALISLIAGCRYSIVNTEETPADTGNSNAYGDRSGKPYGNDPEN